MIKKSIKEMVKINQKMIKKLTREIVEMTIIVLVMYLIASVIKFIEAGGQELIIRRATTVAIIYLIVNMIIKKRAWLSLLLMI